MTKNKLHDYLYNKKYQAINKLRDQFAEEFKAYADKRDAALNTAQVASEIKVHIDSITALHDAWEKQCLAVNKDLRVTPGKYGSVPHTLYNLTCNSDAVAVSMHSYFEDTSAEYTALRKKYSDMEQEIRTNYYNVESNMKKIRMTKDCIQYLVNLGFSASEIAALEPESCTDVMAPVNVKALF